MENYLNAAIAINYIGYDFYRTAQMRKAKKYFFTALKYLTRCNKENENVLRWQGQILCNLCALFRVQKKFITSKLYGFEGLRLRQHCNKNEKIRNKLAIANIYRDEGEIIEALKIYSSLLKDINKILKIPDDFLLKSRALNGVIFCEVRKFNKLHPLECNLIEDYTTNVSIIKNLKLIDDFEEKLIHIMNELKKRGKSESIESIEIYLLLAELMQLKGDWNRAQKEYTNAKNLPERKGNNIFKLIAKQRYLACIYYAAKDVIDINKKTFLKLLKELETEIENKQRKSEYAEISAKLKWLKGNYYFSQLFNKYLNEKFNDYNLSQPNNVELIAEEFYTKAIVNYLEGYNILNNIYCYAPPIFSNLIFNRLNALVNLNENVRNSVILLLNKTKLIKQTDFFIIIKNNFN